MKHPLIANKPREDAGARSANRFSYQISWAICEMMKLFPSNNNFALILEKHEDVVIANCPSTPNKLDFYQIKTKSNKPWTLADLRRAKEGSSFLTKLYSSKDTFKSLANSVNFISDAPCKVKLKSSTEENIINNFCFSEINDKDHQLLEKALKKCFPVLQNNFSKIMFFQTSDLKYDNHEITTIGLMTQFFDSYFDISFRPYIYDLIAGETKRKNNHEGRIRTNQELIKLKSVTRDEFSSWLSKAAKLLVAKNDLKDSIYNEIDKVTEIDFLKRKSLKDSFNSYEIMKKSPDMSLTQFEEATLKNWNLFKDEISGKTLYHCAINLMNKNDLKTQKIYYSQELKIIITMIQIHQS